MLKEFRLSLINKLIEYGLSKEESSSEIDFLIENTLGLTRKDILFKSDMKISDDKKEKIEELIKSRIENKIPLQYLLKKAYFIGEEFYVDENVLIPRPETEILVEKVVNLAKNFKEAKILDIGTGSGCIPIMIAKLLPNSSVVACDISSDALEVAKRNAKQHRVEDRIEFACSDVFSSIDSEFDIIVSNPPYIPEREKKNLQSEVLLHEPHLALFADDEEGIGFYKKIIKESKIRLKSHGYVVFELGINQSDLVKQEFEKEGYKNIEIEKDLSGIDRVIWARVTN